MLSTNHLHRIARRLHAAWQHVATLAERELDQLFGVLERREQPALLRARRRLGLARSAGWDLLQGRLRRELLTRTKALATAIDLLVARLRQGPPDVPGVRFLFDELHQIQADFGNLAVDWKAQAVYAVTEPITLKDVYLGPFALRFCWDRLPRIAGPACFEIVATDPHPADSNDEVTHPHVRRRGLCAGDGAMAVRLALDQGRLADAFQLVRSVLLTYNPDSPHVALAEWSGNRCAECDCSISADDVRSCEFCGGDICDECLSSCSRCRTQMCLGCLDECAVCEDAVCKRCLAATAGSQRRCCPSCRRHCPRCRAVFARDEAAADCNLCPRCRPAPSGGSATPSVTDPPLQETPDAAPLEPAEAAIPY
jgi:hypothetical protein